MVISFKRIAARQYVIANIESFWMAAAQDFGKSYDKKEDSSYWKLPAKFPIVATFYGACTTTHEPDVHFETLDSYRKKLQAQLEAVKEY